MEIREACEKPSPRCNCSWTATLAQKPEEIVLFGGEVVDGEGRTIVFGDLFKYDAARNRWTEVRAPNAPPPRSAHQAVAHGGYLYVFGGEFTSPSQERFHHYRDLWRFDLNANAWEQLPNKGGPSARSGHRMVAHPKGKSLLLFGGFYDTGHEIRYYDDVWELALETMTWKHRAGGGGGAGGNRAVGPSPRSAAHVAAHGDALFVYGGYCKYAGDGDGDAEEKSPATTKEEVVARVERACADEDDEAFARTLRRFFIDGDDEHRSSRIKVCAKFLKAPMLLRKIIPSRPVLVGKRARTLFYNGAGTPFEGKYFECDLVCASNASAKYLYTSFSSLSSKSEEDVAIWIESRERDELPERLLGAVRFRRIGPKCLTKLAVNSR